MRAGHRPPLKLYVRFSRIKCARAHFMRHVVSRNMWRPTGNIHWNQRSGGSGRHITTPTEASAKTSSTRRTKVARAKPWLAQWFKNRSRASADGPLRCRVTTAGFWNKVSNIVGSPLGTGEARPVSTIYLCGVRRGPHDHVKRVIRWPPHISGEHISHTAFTKTHASEMQSKESTEASSPARTRRTTWFPATVASHRSAIA